MKPPKSLKLRDQTIGSGRPCRPGDTAVCECRCHRRNGQLLFASPPDQPFTIRVGGRDCFVGIEYGLLGMKVGGVRQVTVPKNLTYLERRTYPELSEHAMLTYDLVLLQLLEPWDAEMAERLPRPSSSGGQD